MKLLKTITTTLALCACGTAAMIAPAAKAETMSFNVSSAVADPALTNSTSDHAIWLPFFRTVEGTPLQGNANGSDFDFVWDGSFIINDDGSASLTGTVRSQVDQNFGFDVVFNLQRQAGPGSGGPKLELLDSAYIENGGPIDPALWEYFTLTNGSFNGIDEFAGLNFDIEQRPYDNVYPLQLGQGANNKNGNLGASVWFYLFTNSSCYNDLCDDLAYLNLRGDLNVDLSPIPVPAAFLLFGTGLAGFGAMRRARQEKAQKKAKA